MFDINRSTYFVNSIVLASLGDEIINFLPENEGCIFSKQAFTLCWNWIEGQDINLSLLCDCLDSPDEIDFTYYEIIDQENKSIYRILFQIVAYITKNAIMEVCSTIPQYLECVDYNYFVNTFNSAVDKLNYNEEKVKCMLEYCDKKIMKDKNVVIKRYELLNNINK